MDLMPLPAECVFDSQQLTPLLATVRARVTGDRVGFAVQAARLRAATVRNPFDAFIHASALAALAGRRLLADFSIEDMVGEAMALAELGDERVPSELVFPALAATATLIGGGSADPGRLLGDVPLVWGWAALVNQVVAAGLILLLAEWLEIDADCVMSDVTAEALALVG